MGWSRTNRGRWAQELPCPQPWYGRCPSDISFWGLDASTPRHEDIFYFYRSTEVTPPHPPAPRVSLVQISLGSWRGGCAENKAGGGAMRRRTTRVTESQDTEWGGWE